MTTFWAGLSQSATAGCSGTPTQDDRLVECDGDQTHRLNCCAGDRDDADCRQCP